MWNVLEQLSTGGELSGDSLALTLSSALKANDIVLIVFDDNTFRTTGATTYRPSYVVTLSPGDYGVLFGVNSTICVEAYSADSIAIPSALNFVKYPVKIEASKITIYKGKHIDITASGVALGADATMIVKGIYRVNKV